MGRPTAKDGWKPKPSRYKGARSLTTGQVSQLLHVTSRKILWLHQLEIVPAWQTTKGGMCRFILRDVLLLYVCFYEIPDLSTELKRKIIRKLRTQRTGRLVVRLGSHATLDIDWETLRAETLLELERRWEKLHESERNDRRAARRNKKNARKRRSASRSSPGAQPIDRPA